MHQFPFSGTGLGVSSQPPHAALGIRCNEYHILQKYGQHQTICNNRSYNLPLDFPTSYQTLWEQAAISDLTTFEELRERLNQ